MNKTPEVKESRWKLESILLSYYIKYDVLDALIRSVNIKDSVNTVDIYIDLFNLLSNLYGKVLVNDLRIVSAVVDTQYVLISYIMNLVAHYRGFFRNYMHKNTRIYLVYADESCGSHKNFWPSFGTPFNNKAFDFDKINAIVNDQISIIGTLCKYVNDVYYIRSRFSFAIWAYSHIKQAAISDINSTAFVLSYSKYCYMIPAMMVGRPIYQLRPIKHANGDLSIIIRPEVSLLEYYRKLSKKSLAYKAIQTFHPMLMSLMFSFNGCSSMDLTMAANINRTTAIIREGIKDLKLLNGYQSDPGYIYNSLKKFGIQSIFDELSFNHRFYATDIEYQSKIYYTSIESKDITWKINLYDPETLKQLNNTEFQRLPIDLINL